MATFLRKTIHWLYRDIVDCNVDGSCEDETEQPDAEYESFGRQFNVWRSLETDK